MANVYSIGQKYLQRNPKWSRPLAFFGPQMAVWEAKIGNHGLKAE